MKIINKIIILVITFLLGCTNQIVNQSFPIKNENFDLKKVSDKNVEINFLTLNTAGLPSPLGKDIKERMTRIGQSIKDFDIVCLQEAFTKDARLIGLNSNFKYQHWENNGRTLKLGSGLYNLSKYKIKDIKFQEHPKGIGWDKYARKGVLFTRIEVPKLGDIDIYNTHYQSSMGKEEEEIRLKDNKVLTEFINQNNQGNLTIMCGDFNMLPDSREYKDLYLKTLFIDSFKSFNPSNPGYTFDPLLNPYASSDKEPRQRLDYIFIIPNFKYMVKILKSEVVFTSSINGYFLSDHFGLNTRIQIRKVIN